jgi:hypothetical protein
LTVRAPWLTEVMPVKMFAPLKVIVPEPVFVSLPPVPEMVPP